MGVTTDFIGHIEVNPPLNIAEQHYLLAFADSRRSYRPDGPYSVPGNPAAERDDVPEDIDAYNTIAAGQPSLWCQWRPCWGGDCLAFDGREKFYAAAAWMSYLIDHFLAPDARAAGSELACFEEFTFDHVLDGIVAACQRDTRELYLIEVDTNTVAARTLHAPERGYVNRERLPYEIAIDDAEERRPRPRPRSTS